MNERLFLFACCLQPTKNFPWIYMVMEIRGEEDYDEMDKRFICEAKQAEAASAIKIRFVSRAWILMRTNEKTQKRILLCCISSLN